MLRIVGGTIYDPANGIDGVEMDLNIQDGKIVISQNEPADRQIDARGCIIFPGGVDVHTHVAGSSLNIARSLIPESHRHALPIQRSGLLRSGHRSITPTTFATGYIYAGMGWTTVNEAAVPPCGAKHTHQEFQDIPILDKTSCILMANNEIILDLLEKGEYERAKQVLAWYIVATQAYGVKAVNAGGVAAWKWGKDAKKLSDVIVGYQSLTVGDLVQHLAKMVDELQLPHPLHIHCNNLGAPGNIETTLETLRVIDGHRAHIAHLQYHAYGGTDWESISSESQRLAEYFNHHPNLSMDAGAVLFGDSVTLSADGPWQYLLYQLSGQKWLNIDVENETGCGVVPYVYREKNIVNAVQWAVGLELLLLIENPWQVCLTTDHPNGASFWRYPEILHLLMNATYRREEFSRLPQLARSRTCLMDILREYTLSEIAIITSAAPARILGLKNKGHLGAGADADVVIYNRSANIQELFSHPRYVIKQGHVIVDDGDIRTVAGGTTYHTLPQYDLDIHCFLEKKFDEQYSIRIANYPVQHIENLKSCELM